MGLRTGGRRAKSLKNRVKSSKIELRFREVRSEGCSSRTSVQQALIYRKDMLSNGSASAEPFLFICSKTLLNCGARHPASAAQLSAPQFSKCNGDDRSQRLKQGGAVGAAASKTRAPLKVRSGCWVPQPGGTFPAALLRQSRFCLYAAKPLLNRGARHPADSGTAAAVLKVSAIAPDCSRHIFHSCAILMWKMKARKHHEIWHH